MCAGDLVLGWESQKTFHFKLRQKFKTSVSKLIWLTLGVGEKDRPLLNREIWSGLRGVRERFMMGMFGLLSDVTKVVSYEDGPEAGESLGGRFEGSGLNGTRLGDSQPDGEGGGGS